MGKDTDRGWCMMKKKIIQALIFIIILINGTFPADASDEWVCPKCGNNQIGKFCNYCGQQKPDGDISTEYSETTSFSDSTKNGDVIDQVKVAFVELEQKYENGYEYNTVHAYDDMWRQVWSYNCTPGVAMQPCRASISESPDYVYLIEPLQYLKLDKQTGEVLITTPVLVGGSPQMCMDPQGNIYVVGYHIDNVDGGIVYCIQDDGVIKWELDLDDDFWWPYNLTVDDGILTIQDEAEHIYRSVTIDADSGRIIEYKDISDTDYSMEDKSNLDFSDGYVYNPQNGPLLMHQESADKGFPLYQEHSFSISQYIVETGEEYEVFSYEGGVFQTVIDFDVNWMPGYQLRELFSPDMTKMAVSWNDDQDGSKRVGWIDKNGNVTDISEKLHPSTTDFESTTPNDIAPIFTPNGEFFFVDTNTEKYCYVDVDDLSLTRTEEYITKTNYGITNNIYSILFLPDGSMTEMIDDRLVGGYPDYQSIHCNGNVFYVHRVNANWPGMLSYDFAGEDALVGVVKGNSNGGYYIGKYGKDITNPDRKYGYDLYDYDDYIEITPDTEFKIDGCAYGYGKVAFTGVRGTDRGLFVVEDDGSKSVKKIADITSHDKILFW